MVDAIAVKEATRAMAPGSEHETLKYHLLGMLLAINGLRSTH